MKGPRVLVRGGWRAEQILRLFAFLHLDSLCFETGNNAELRLAATKALSDKLGSKSINFRWI